MIPLAATPAVCGADVPAYQGDPPDTGPVSLQGLLGEGASALLSKGMEEKTTTVNTWLAAMPLQFIANGGQSDEDVRFEIISDGGSIFFTPRGPTFSLIGRDDDEELKSAVITYHFLGTPGSGSIRGLDQIPCSANFLIGKDPSQWVTGMEMYRGIQYDDLYSGIDLVYYGTENGLKSIFVVAPNADPTEILIEYRGQTSLSLQPDGSLRIRTPAGDLTELAPVCYQEIDGTVKPVECSFSIKNENTVAFSLGKYDTGQTLVIDPVMKYGLYLRGIGIANGYGVAVDDERNAYVTGISNPTPYIVPDSAEGANAGGTDAIVVKVNQDGTLPLYITYLGGSNDDKGSAISVDRDGYAYVTGTTSSTDFPLENPIQAEFAGNTDVFLSRIGLDGSTLVFSTYLGGTGDDEGNAITLDTDNDIYITGSTDSILFPVISRYQRTYLAGQQDAYILKIDSNGTQLLYSNYIGGTTKDVGYGVAVDGNNNPYITGETYSWNFPTKDAYNAVFSGYSDVFVTKVGSSGESLVYSTYIGGKSQDAGRSIAVDEQGSAYITGLTRSLNYPTMAAFQPSSGGIVDAFMSRISPDGRSLEYSTYLGGTGYDEGRGIAVDSARTVYISGATSSRNLAVIDPYQEVFGGGTYDAFVAKFTPFQAAPDYFTYLGGNGLDVANAVATDGSGGAYITGLTGSVNFPTIDPYPTTFGDRGQGGFLAVLLDEVEPPRVPTADFGADVTSGMAPRVVQFQDLSTGYPTSWQWVFGDGNTSTDRNPVHTYSAPGTYTVNLTATNFMGSDTRSRPGYITIGGIPPTTSPTTTIPTTTPTTTIPTTTPTTTIPTTTPTTTIPTTSPTTTIPTTSPTPTPTIIPQLPHLFYGNVTLGGIPAPTGTNITAVVTDGGGSLITDTVGVYGSAGFTGNKLTVQGAIPENAPIEFYVNGNQAECHDVQAGGAWQLSYPFTSGEVTELDLRVPEPTTTPTTVPTTSPTTTVPTTSPTTTIPTTTPTTTPTVIPELPHAFYGGVHIGGVPAPVGVTIEAIVAGGGGTLITDEIGAYGSPATGDKLLVQGNISDTSPIEFLIEGRDAECHDVVAGGDWQDTYPFGPGGVTELDLRLLGPIANFSATPTSGIVPLEVQFTDTTIGQPVAWQWDFGDNTTSPEQNPVHTYDMSGFFTVSLTVDDGTYTDSVTKDAYIFVQSQPVGGDRGYFLVHCNVDGAEVYFDDDYKGMIESGTLPVQVYITAAPYRTYTVQKTGYSTVTGNITQYPAKDQTVHLYVTLEPVTDYHTILATAGDNGTIDPSGEINVPDGGSQGFTITPDDEYRIENVFVNGVGIGPSGSYEFTNVTEDQTIHATFAAEGPDLHTITAIAGEHGSIEPSGLVSVASGGSADFTISPDSGYEIADVLVNSVSIGPQPFHRFENVTEDQTIHATFRDAWHEYYYINATAGTGGMITPSGLIAVPPGGTQNFTITPYYNYIVQNVMVDGDAKGAVSEWMFPDVISNHTISATFKQQGGGGGGGGGGG
ncbi:MAG: SBBP repeat-containing protein, partial [Methanoregulaceae archaeon]